MKNKIELVSYLIRITFLFAIMNTDIEELKFIGFLSHRRHSNVNQDRIKLRPLFTIMVPVMGCYCLGSHVFPFLETIMVTDPDFSTIFNNNNESITNL